MRRVAAIPTMASRAETFHKVLPVIHAQVDHVFIYLDGYVTLPTFLSRFDRVTVRRTEDIGGLHASSRFLCLEELSAPTVVVIADDDIIYPPDYVARLVAVLQRLEGQAIVGVYGRIFVPPHQSYVRDVVTFHFAQELPRDWHVHEVGTGTCAFISSNFNVNPKKWGRSDMDDINVAIEGQQRGLPRIVIARAAGWLKAHAESQPDSLWIRTQIGDSEQSRRMRALLSLYSIQSDGRQVSSVRPAGSPAVPPIPAAVLARGASAAQFRRNAGLMHVYLSPHLDDVCFSIGHLASQAGGHLVNLFTRSSYVGARLSLPANAEERVEFISRLRQREDRLFTEAAQLVRHDLGLSEPALLDHGPFDLTDLEVEIAALSSRLMPALSMLPTEGEPLWAHLYCPMGIGGHRNHLSTLLAVRRAYDTLCHRCTVFLYEDLHYASVPRARHDGVRRAIQLYAGTVLSPIVLPIAQGDAESKMQLIRLYASQHAHVPRVADFTPASGFSSDLHEIIWKVSLSNGGQKEPGPRTNQANA